MVSKARLDLPLPLGPVTTVSFPSGRSTSIPLRLFWRAPRISMQSVRDAAATRSLFPIFEPTGNNSRLRGDSQPVAASLCEAHDGPLIPHALRRPQGDGYSDAIL